MNVPWNLANITRPVFLRKIKIGKVGSLPDGSGYMWQCTSASGHGEQGVEESLDLAVLKILYACGYHNTRAVETIPRGVSIGEGSARHIT